MSLIRTLARVAIGVAVAKSVSTLAKGARGGGYTGSRTAGRSAGGGLEDMMGDLLGGGRTAGGGTLGGGTIGGGTLGGGTAGGGNLGGGNLGGGGSLGGLLNELGGTAGQRSTRTGAPDLGTIFGELTRGTSRTGTGGTATGGLGDLLGSLASAGAAGGLGGLLGGALAGGKDGNTSGSLGGMLDSALKTGNEPEVAPAPEHELAAAVLLKAMIQAAKADGQIDAAEQARLTDKLGDISAEERSFIEAELAAPSDPEGVAKLVPAGLETQAYAMSLMAIDLDNQTEAQYLDKLAKALSIAPADVNAIHEKLGAPKLYA